MNLDQLIVGIKKELASEVKETKKFNEAESKIISYFKEIKERIRDELQFAYSINLEINPDNVEFIEFTLNGYGIVFERRDDSIEVNEVLEDRVEVRYFDSLVYNKGNDSIVSKSLGKLSNETLDRYLEIIFSEYVVTN